MPCINVTYDRVGNGLSVDYSRVGNGLTVSFAPVCGSSEGVPYLFDSEGARLLDSEAYYLIAKP